MMYYFGCASESEGSYGGEVISKSQVEVSTI